MPDQPDLRLLNQALAAICRVKTTDEEGHYALLNDLVEGVSGVTGSDLARAVQALCDGGLVVQEEPFPWKIRLTERAYDELERVFFELFDPLKREPPDPEEKT